MTGTIMSDPRPRQGKRIVPTSQTGRGREYLQTLPYEPFRVEPVCLHSPLYVLQLQEGGPRLCGLCLFREGWESEIPTRFHAYKQLAENGNPETAPKFLAHMVLAMGLVPPSTDEDLREWRNRRISLAREQYTRRSPLPGSKKLIKVRRVERYSSPSRLFPVSSALWKLLGYQPPLGRVLIPAVISGRNETQLSAALGISLWDAHVRMAKGIRTAVGFLPDGEQRANPDSAREEHNTDSEPQGAN